MADPLVQSAEFLEELVGRDLLPSEEEFPSAEQTQEGARALAIALREEAQNRDAKLAAMVGEMHPLVRCTDCDEESTHCELGNVYCPSCGHSLDGMPLASVKEGSEGDPWCWCGHARSRHEAGICRGCELDAQPGDEADPHHEFEVGQVDA